MSRCSDLQYDHIAREISTILVWKRVEPQGWCEEKWLCTELDLDYQSVPTFTPCKKAN